MSMIDLSKFPLTREAYMEYTTPFNGVELRRYLNLDFFIKMAKLLGRQITAKELRIFIDLDGEITCHICGTVSTAVKWQIPTETFLAHLRETRDLQQSLETVKLPQVGCFFVKPNNGEMIAVCGHAFPIFVEGAREKSCLADLKKEIGQSGLPRSKALEAQENLRKKFDQDEIDAYAEHAEWKVQKEREAAEAAERQRQKEEALRIERERKKRVRLLAKDFALAR